MNASAMNLRSTISLAIAFVITFDVANGYEACSPELQGCCPGSGGAVCVDKAYPHATREAEHYGSYRYNTFHCLSYEDLVCK
ncbi:hypothetical protein MJO28_003446 [Puccinia striiformis f. sp. tritici]|uniref:Uncharacterized protein n=1 Tax=Puccinia striiformis f. sp. tritici TaxID=168172 RepID=A0ACC0EUY3_9BASI|nr:hypothetical protein Pst134EA_004646 [Puccinia striiformis f. sp. tritici]KAH9470722.1 hypothetical protein Pst134EA_004646 [Puccinia striiformis f. sp. tritici]KAI7959655.1 hypothetical protein MJO28_003446 [Puccinia striiformis f. sp. tritici]